MAQFDVHEIAGYGLVVDCQNDFLSALRSRVIAPLRLPDDPSVSGSRLNPLVIVNDAQYRIATQFVRSVDRIQLGPKVGSLVAYEYEIKAALDLLISGY